MWEEIQIGQRSPTLGFHVECPHPPRFFSFAESWEEALLVVDSAVYTKKWFARIGHHFPSDRPATTGDGTDQLEEREFGDDESDERIWKLLPQLGIE